MGLERRVREWRASVSQAIVNDSRRLHYDVPQFERGANHLLRGASPYLESQVWYEVLSKACRLQNVSLLKYCLTTGKSRPQGTDYHLLEACMRRGDPDRSDPDQHYRSRKCLQLLLQTGVFPEHDVALWGNTMRYQAARFHDMVMTPDIERLFLGRHEW